ncbi:MAG: leucine--tRNA ligase [Nanoarchaeota archaeon]|nr:leucine--tRNA ligase [Nanoarchaeota archaeon]
MYNFKAIEKKWQKKWEEKKVFESKINNKTKFFFTTPYPYISGSLHLGHGRAVTESDIYCRFKRMQGLNVLFPLSFHISGTPVLGISAAIKNKDKNKLKLYEKYISAYEKDKSKVKKIVNSFTDPKKIVKFFIPKMIKEYKNLGLSVDWSRSFTSGDLEHQQMVTWQFQKYKEKNYIVRGEYPVLYSIQDQSSMGEDDIQDGDSNPVEKQDFTLLKFKFKNKILVAATLRPETVYGQTNLWVNPNTDYFEAKVGYETWILSKEALEKLKYQRKDVEEFGKTKENLVGEYAKSPMINRKLIILPSKFVDPDVGSGVVTSVPSDAPYDYVALKELQKSGYLKRYFNDKQIKEIKKIKAIPIIKTKKYGDVAAELIVKKHNINSQEDIKLEKLTKEIYKEGFHNGILLSNCFKYSGMKVNESKEKIKKEMIEKGEAEIMYETSRKAYSRSGGKIIVAVLDNQWFIDFNAKGWKEEAYSCLKDIELIPAIMRKQFEGTFDWLDKRPCARKRGLGTKLPFDKNWIIESLSDSTIYMTLYTINNLIKKNKLKKENLTYEFFEFVYLGKGDIKKVSKKTKVKGFILKELRKSFEYWMPNDHRHTFVLHLPNHLSFMIFSHVALFPKKYWPKKITFHGLVVSEGSKMSKSKGNIITLLHVKEIYGADVFRFYMTQSTNINSTFDWRENDAKNAKLTIERLYHVIETSIRKRGKGKVRNLYLFKFNNIIKNATEKLNNMQLREYNNLVIFDILRLVNNAKLSMDDKELSSFYYSIVEDWIKLINPVCPHLAEELWGKLGKNSFVSLEKWPKFQNIKISENVEKEEKLVSKVQGDVIHLKKILKIEHPKTYIYSIPSEVKILKDNENFLAKTTGSEAIIIHPVNEKDKYDPENKSKKSKPGKPGIYLEN